MAEITRCPKCNKLFTVNPGQQGQGANCPFCRQSLVIPLSKDTGSDLPAARHVPFPGLMLVWLLPAFVWGCISTTTTLAAITILTPSQPEMFFVVACGGTIAIFLQVLLCICLCRGQRLARQATLALCYLWLLLTLLGTLAGAILLLIFWHAAWSELSTAKQVMPLAVLAIGELIHAVLVVGLLLNLTSASGTLRYFGLVCPACGNLGGQAVDLLYKRVRCPSCRCEWGG